ncbi:hypothetical protein AB4P42_28420 [Escherichia coli]
MESLLRTYRAVKERDIPARRQAFETQWNTWISPGTERSLKGDFNSSCFSSGLLYVEHSLADVLSRQVNNIELLKVITSDDRDFYYANVVGKIPALHYNNRQELQIMSRTQEYKFNNSINEMLIFRDEILPSNYFVTDRFVDIFQNDFRGVIFKKVGEI